MKKAISLVLLVIVLFITSAGRVEAKQNDIGMTIKNPLATELYKAIQEGKLDTVKQMLAENQIDLKSFTKEIQFNLLDIATNSGHLELVKYFIEQGVDINVSGKSGRIVLHYAIWHGKTEIAYYLINEGANVNALYKANGGLTPLCCAAEYGDLELVKYLIEHGADIGYENGSSGASPARSAAYKGHLDVFKYLTDHDRIPENFDWQLSLSQAVIGGNLELVKYIVESKKADVNKASSHWGYPIHIAAERWSNTDNINIMEYLLSRGAKLKDINNGEIFPWALEKCNDETIAFLLDKGVEYVPNQSERSWPPLPDALDRGYLNLAQYLLKSEKDHSYRGLPLVVFFADGMNNSAAIIKFLIHNNVNKEYYSQAFLRSAASGDLESMKLLLDTGVDINMTDGNNYNALALTRSKVLASYLISEGINVDNEKFKESIVFNFEVLEAVGEAGVKLDIPIEKVNKALIDAARIGNEWVVDYLLKQGANPNFRYSNIEVYWQGGNRKDTEIETTPLIENAMQGYSSCSYGSCSVPANVAHLLLKAGADVNIIDKKGKTALHYASGDQWCRTMIGPIPMGSRREREMGFHGDPAVPPTQSHDAIMKALIDGGADINIQDNDGNTPLMLAAIYNNTAGIEILLQRGARPDLKNKEEKAFFDLISDADGIISLVKIGLKDKIQQDVLNRIYVDLCTKERYNYDVDKIKILLDNGADVNYKDGFHSAPSLHFIIEHGYESDVFYEVINLLLDQGYDLDMKVSSLENTALYTAIDKRRPLRLIKLLLDYGADINAQNLKGDTPLMRSLSDYNPQPDIFSFLIEKGADIHIKNKSQMTALTLANVFGYKEADILVSIGAKRDLVAEWWLSLAYYYDKFDNLQKLINEGIDINMKSSYEVNYRHKIPAHGITALMHMASLNNAEKVKQLIAMGADVNIKDNNGRTAIDYPYENWEGKAETLEALRSE